VIPKHTWNEFKCLNAFIQTFYTFLKKRVLNACGESERDGSCDHHGGSCGEFCDSEPFDCYNIHQEKKNILNVLTIQLCTFYVN